jgi:acyl-phosphate glycerol 3-phosphate acyltransferase
VNYLVVAIAYVLGTLPSAQVVAGRSGVDPMSAGSGNPGATNVYRTAGRRAGLVVFALDVGKGVAAVLMGMAVAGRPLALACWAAATVGHVLPVTRRLRGGKGVATGGGGSGRTNCIAFHPANSNIILLGSASGGIWRSVNKGKSWSTNTDGFENLGISDIGIRLEYYP